jgi:hypothetical protein
VTARHRSRTIAFGLVIGVTLFAVCLLFLVELIISGESGYDASPYYETATAIGATNSHVETLIAATQAAASATAKAPF